MTDEKKKETLSDFIDKYYKLFTALGVCLAVTMFAKSIPVKFFSYSISLIFFLLAFLLLTEIFMKAALTDGTWKVSLVENLMLWALGLLGLDLLMEHTIPIIVIAFITLFFGLSVVSIYLFPTLRKRDKKILFYKNDKFSFLKTVEFGIFIFAIQAICLCLTIIIFFTAWKVFGQPYHEMKDAFTNIIK